MSLMVVASRRSVPVHAWVQVVRWQLRAAVLELEVYHRRVSYGRAKEAGLAVVEAEPQVPLHHPISALL